MTQAEAVTCFLQVTARLCAGHEYRVHASASDASGAFRVTTDDGRTSLSGKPWSAFRAERTEHAFRWTAEVDGDRTFALVGEGFLSDPRLLVVDETASRAVKAAWT